MIISFSRKFIFFKAAKTGGSSVEDALAHHCCPKIDIVTPDDHTNGMNYKTGQGACFNHMRPRQLLETQIISLQDLQVFHKITVCRNIWDRQVSGFWWLMVAVRDAYAGMTIQQVQGRYLKDFQEFITSLYANYGQRDISEEFYFMDGYPLCDTVLRFESLQQDFNLLCSRLAIPSSVLPRHKSHTRLLDTHYRDYYTDSMRMVLAEHHKKEIEFFGYEF